MQPVTYIIASQRNGTLYTGVTSDLVGRIYQHKNGLLSKFTKKYGCKILVFYEVSNTMESAITREKKIKNLSRKKKLELIESFNPTWRDLYEEII